MAKYRNIGILNITVRGVTIKPGETKDLKGFANDPNLLRITYSKYSDNKSKKKLVDKPVEVPATVDSNSQSTQLEPKTEPEKVTQPESKKDEKQNSKSGGQ